MPVDYFVTRYAKSQKLQNHCIFNAYIIKIENDNDNNVVQMLATNGKNSGNTNLMNL